MPLYRASVQGDLRTTVSSCELSSPGLGSGLEHGSQLSHRGCACDGQSRAGGTKEKLILMTSAEHGSREAHSGSSVPRRLEQGNPKQKGPSSCSFTGETCKYNTHQRSFTEHILHASPTYEVARYNR